MKNHVIGFLMLGTIVTTTAFLSINNANARDSDYEDLPGDYPPYVYGFDWCGMASADPDNCKPKPQVYCEDNNVEKGKWNAKEVKCALLHNYDFR